MKDRSRKVRHYEWRKLRIAFVLLWTISLVALWPFLEALTAQEPVPPPPQSRAIQRIRVDLRRTAEILFAESITSIIVLDPEIASATVQRERNVLLTGSKPGETILIVFGQTQRITYAVDVIRSTTNATAIKRRGQVGEEPQSFSGSQSFYFTPGTAGSPSLLRYSFDYRQQRHGNRILRTGAELFRFFGNGDRSFSAPLAARIGANRLMLGIDSSTVQLDLLDSQVDISRLGLHGYTLRGPHLVSTAKSRRPGLEFFAGNARPQLAIFSNGEGRLVGTTVPIVDSPRLRVRAGSVWIGPAERDNSGGFVWHTDFRYSPDQKTQLAGDLAWSKGKLSGRARLDMQYGPFTFSGEALHLDHNSPMIAIGAQAQGRTHGAVNLHWQPAPFFNATATFSRTAIAPSAGSIVAEPNSRTLLVTANFHPARRSHFGFTLNHQLINLPASSRVQIPLSLEVRSAVFKWDQRMSHHWTNNVEGRIIFSRENNTGLQTNQGTIIREQLRYNGGRFSAAGFINFRRNTPSLESMVLRNPSLLPADFRAAFITNPQRFLLANRDALPLLLRGMDLPLTRNTEVGANIQASLRRIDFAGEAVYSTGAFGSTPQRDLRTTVAGNLKLDAANSLQLTFSRSFAFAGGGDQTAITFGYVHCFGSGSNGGFQFSRLFGIGRGRIRGRVFMDHNADGLQNAGEQGLAGVKIQLDGRKTSTTDAQGYFNFEALEPGDFEIALLTNDLGITLRASTATLHRVSLSPRQTADLAFGLTNAGEVAGRIFNDLLLTGQHDSKDAPGLKDVLLKLYVPDDAPAENRRSFTRITDHNGQYEFRGLPPGQYILDVDPNTVPANFRLPRRTSWVLTLAPLQRLYLDLPFAAERAISGLVYIDKDNDGQFDAAKDSVVEGARIVSGRAEAVSTRDGLYLLRNLPAGKLELEVHSRAGLTVTKIRLELGPEPTLRTGVNLRIKGLP
jgi:SdrD B-like domain/Pilus formation protein N terminal region